MSSRDRRALGIGTLIVVAALITLRGGPWAWQWAGESLDHLQARAALLDRIQNDLQRASVLEDSAATIRRQFLALAPKLLSGGTPSEAFADLAGRITTAAQHSRVRLDRTDMVPGSARGGELDRVTMQGTIEGDTRGTVNFLMGIAADRAVLTVDRVRIMAPDPTSAATTPEVLHTELVLHGWYLRQEGRR